MERYHIYPWEVILVIALVAFVLYTRRQQALRSGAASPRKKPGEKESPAEAYMRLRYQALTTIAARLGLPGELKPDTPYGVVMEMGIPNSVVTLAAFADGDARLYYKTGGGMVGGISHENVRRAAQEFVGLSRKVLGRMTRVTEYPLPEPDRVRFYVLTPRGVFSTETDRQRLGEIASDLSTLFRSGQEVVTQMREVQEHREATARPLMVPRPPVVEDEEAAEPAPPAEPA
jgi:hypothetical protein